MTTFIYCLKWNTNLYKFVSHIIVLYSMTACEFHSLKERKSKQSTYFAFKHITEWKIYFFSDC